MKQIVKNIILMLFLGAVYFIIGYLIAIPLAKRFDIVFKDMLFYEGMIVTCIFLWFSVHGNKSLRGLQGLGKKNAQAYAHMNIETMRAESESVDNIKNFKENNVLELGFKSATVAIGGILMVLCSMFWI